MEKERYELFGEHCIKDNDDNARCQLLDAYKACVILNEQNERIKELEEENQQLREKYISTLTSDVKENSKLQKENQQLREEIKQLKFDCAMYKSANYLINDVGIDKAREIMFQSEQKLKQSQNQKAIEVLEKIRNYFFVGDCSLIDGCELEGFIDNQIKELRGEEND